MADEFAWFQLRDGWFQVISAGFYEVSGCFSWFEAVPHFIKYGLNF